MGSSDGTEGSYLTSRIILELELYIYVSLVP